MTTIKSLDRVTIDDAQRITVIGHADNYTLHHVREAFAAGDLVRESAGPGWGTHNALLRPRRDADGEGGRYPLDALPVFEPWWGEYLATIDD